jgi:ribosomal-protein-alanine N-acetyltransferase
MDDQMAKILETDRLILQIWEFRDAADLFEICSDPEVMLRIGDGLPFEKIEQAEKFIDWAISKQKTDGFSRWAVVEKESNKVIGSCGFTRLNNGEVELGYLLACEFWGKGLATEAAAACVEYGFKELGLNGLVALTDLDHSQTHRVLEKAGFRRRGIQKIHLDEDLVFEIKNQASTD